jgi:hypothetical protein
MPNQIHFLFLQFNFLLISTYMEMNITTKNTNLCLTFLIWFNATIHTKLFVKLHLWKNDCIYMTSCYNCSTHNAFGKLTCCNMVCALSTKGIFFFLNICEMLCNSKLFTKCIEFVGKILTTMLWIHKHITFFPMCICWSFISLGESTLW